MAALLEHYGLIGDTTTIALISNAGSLDWLCLPRIDSDACFAKLLGTNDHGYWAIRPAAEVREVKRRYRPDTLILETEIACDGGRIRIIDFMIPCVMAEHDIIRIVEGIEGSVPIHLDLKARFAYGHLVPWIKCEDRHATMTSGPDALALDSPVPLRPDFEGARVEADFVVRAGDPDAVHALSPSTRRTSATTTRRSMRRRSWRAPSATGASGRPSASTTARTATPWSVR